MNRVVNIFTFLTLLVFCFMVMVSSWDLGISNLHLKGMPYKRETFTAMAIFVFLLGLLRAQRRWQGMRDMKKFATFRFAAHIPASHRKMGIVVTSLEILFFVAVILFCRLFLKLDPMHVVPMLAVAAVLSFESLIFVYRMARGGDSFRIGLNEDIVAYFDREMHLFYYTGLRQVSLHQQDLISFEYREDLTLTVETGAIPKESRKAFRDALIAVLEAKNVYVDDSFRNWE